MQTEKQKMLSGELYNAFDAALVTERNFAKEIIYEHNQLRPSQTRDRKLLIKKLFGSVGSDFIIEQPFYCDYGYNIHIGENFFANFNCVILDEAPVSFGNNVMLGPNVSIYTAGHPLDIETRNAGIEYAHPVTIGNNVWVGGNVVILPGISVGDNSVIGAGSVVTKNIPANVVAVGNPCKVLREIFDK